MKKNLVMLAVAMLLALPVVAKVKIGVRGGLNIGNVSYDKEVISSRNRNGFFAGPTLKIGTPIVDIDAAALYNQLDMEVEESEFKKKTLDLQINVRKGFGLGDRLGLFVFAGPQWGVNIGEKSMTLSGNGTESREWRWKRDVEFSVNVGVGVMVLNHLELRVSYNFTDGKTADINDLDNAGNILSTLNSTKTNACQIGATVYF